MVRRVIKPVLDPFTSITSDEDWEAKGWSRESEPLTAAPQLGAMISIRLDPNSASLVRRAARLLGMTRSEFVQRVAVSAAAEALEVERP